MLLVLTSILARWFAALASPMPVPSQGSPARALPISLRPSSLLPWNPHALLIVEYHGPGQLPVLQHAESVVSNGDGVDEHHSHRVCAAPLYRRGNGLFHGGNRRVFSPLPGDAQHGVVDAVPREILAFVLAYFLHDEWLGVSIPFSAVSSAGATATGRCQGQEGLVCRRFTVARRLLSLPPGSPLPWLTRTATEQARPCLSSPVHGGEQHPYVGCVAVADVADVADDSGLDDGVLVSGGKRLPHVIGVAPLVVVADARASATSPAPSVAGASSPVDRAAVRLRRPSMKAMNSVSAMNSPPPMAAVTMGSLHVLGKLIPCPVLSLRRRCPRHRRLTPLT